jgi:hypothetical protein
VRSRLTPDGSDPESLGAVWIAELLRAASGKSSD